MKYLAILLFPVITSCTFLGETKIETPEEQLVVLEYSYQAALKTIDRMVDTGVIKGDKATTVSRLLGSAGLSVKAAREAVATNVQDLATYLSAANHLIFQLIEYLAIQEREETSWRVLSLLFKPYQQFYLPLRWQVGLS